MRTRRAKRSAAADRDQHESAFSAILASMVVRIAGARAAALVDADGETVDYSGRLDPFAMRVAAAHWRIVIDLARSQPSLADVLWITLRAGRVSFLVHDLPEGYAIVLQLTRAAGFAEWRRALSACGRSLAREAGWPTRGAAWVPVAVETDARRRPSHITTGSMPGRIEILGALAGDVGSRERGWRVRFPSGIEATLVREPGGWWYSDEPIEREGSAPPRRRPEQSR